MGNEITVRSKKVNRAKAANRASLLAAILLAACSIGFTAGCTNIAGSTNPAAAQQLSLQFAPASLNFGTVPSGKKTSQTASVTNAGTNSATIAQITSSSNQFTISGLTFPLTLAPAQTVNFMVWFNGTAPTPGKTAGTLTFQGGNGATAPSTAQISVTATEVTPQPQLVVSPANLDTGSATVGTKTTSNVTLSNAGTADLTVSVLTVAGTQFSVSGIATP